MTGEVDWLLVVPPEDLTQVEAALSGFCERLGHGLLLLSFGNAVGVLAVPGLGALEVVSGKWTRRHFDWMLEDLTAVAGGLPFAAGAGAALPFDRSIAAREDVLYHAFVYLRRVLSDEAPAEDRLLPALELVLREPHRQLERQRPSVPPELVRRVDPAGLVEAVAERVADAGGQEEIVKLSWAGEP